MKSSLWIVVALLLLASVGLGCERKQEAAEQVPPAEAEPSEPTFSEAPPPEPPPALPARGQLDPRVVYSVPLDGTEPQRGPDDALMTIVEFGDFQCPYCAKAAPTMNQLVERYGDEIRVVWLNFPQQGHPGARPAATAALEAQAQKGDAAFWKMHDQLFANPRALSRDDLLGYGKELGLNLKKLQAALDNDKYAEVIDRQSALAKRLNVPGTPSWFMNGRYMAGFPYETWVGAIDRRIGGARAAVAQGVPEAELYDRIAASGKKSP